MSRSVARVLLPLFALSFAGAQLAPLARFSSSPSECAVIAGEIHECIAAHGEASCGRLFDAHYDCVSGEIDASVADEAGMEIDHRPYTRLTRGRHGFFLYHPFDIYFASSLELYGEWSEVEFGACLCAACARSIGSARCCRHREGPRAPRRHNTRHRIAHRHAHRAVRLKRLSLCGYL